MKFGKKTLSILAGCLSAAVLMTACSSPAQTGEPSASPASSPAQQASKLSVVGSTSVAPLAEELAAAYTGATLEIQAVGSTAGVTATLDKSADIGMSSRDLKQEELDQNVVPTAIAHDGIAVVLNPANGVSNLTKEQIAKIFKGEIKNWSEVGGADSEIVVVVREPSSGTRSTFDELMGLEDKDTKESLISADAMVASSNGEVKSSIAGKENGIGYISLGILDDTVKAATVDGVAPSAQTVKDATYPISRSLYLLTLGQPAGEAKSFIDFCLSADGQEIVSKEFITVND